MIENRLKIEREIDEGRQEVHRQMEESAPGLSHHRHSSFDVPTRQTLPSADVDNGSMVDSAAEDSSGSPARLRSPSPAPREATPPVSNAKRRQQILARLGLKHAVATGSRSPSSGGRGMNGNSGGMFGADDSDATMSGRDSGNESSLRRRLSLGNIGKGRKSSWRSQSVPLGDAVSSSEDEFGENGGVAGWSSGASNH